MIRNTLFAICVAATAALGLAARELPAWPAVAVLLLLVVVFMALLWADRDTRLDVEARKDAHRAKLIADEYVKRLLVIEEWQRSAIAQRQAQAAQPAWKIAANGPVAP